MVMDSFHLCEGRGQGKKEGQGQRSETVFMSANSVFVCVCVHGGNLYTCYK